MASILYHIRHLAPCGVLAFQVIVSARAAGHEGMEMLRRRMVESILRDGGGTPTQYAAAGRQALADLRPDGMWPDVDYRDRTPGPWKTQEHLVRTLAMARALRAPGSPLVGDAGLKAGVVSSLSAWIRQDIQNPNWWHNQISVPRAVGEILLLLGGDAPPDILRASAPLLARSDWETPVGSRTVRWTGANLVDMARNRVLRGLLQGNEAMVDDALQHTWAEVRIVAPGEEGIQADMSFHQHGSLIYDGGYGEVFVGVMANLMSLARETRFAAPATTRDLLVRYVLDGPQWMIRGMRWDYGVLGRGVTRPNRSATGFALVLNALADVAGPRAGEVRAFARRIRDQGEPPLTGNRHFWRSDLMVHQRPGWYASARGYSRRTLNTDGAHNGEGRASHHLADGANYLMRSGDEYRDIFPVWDWRKVPGTTVVQSGDPFDPESLVRKGATSFVGGVSDGEYGVAAMELDRDGLKLMKAWFFFDKEYVCLGTGLTGPMDGTNRAAPLGDTARNESPRIATTVDQRLLAGPVVTDASRDALAIGERQLDARWVLHDGVGYLFPPGTRPHLEMRERIGRWSDIGAGSGEIQRRKVFTLWLEHGTAPLKTGYQYTVVPNTDARDLARRADADPIRILSNTPKVQAVVQTELGILQAVFHRAATVRADGWTLTVDQPCLIQARRVAGRWRVAASNPRNEALRLTVRLRREGEETVTLPFDLPGGAEAGRSIVRAADIKKRALERRQMGIIPRNARNGG